MDKSFSILGQLSDDDVEWISANGVHRLAAQGETIITMGIPSDAIYFLLEGEISIAIDKLGEIARLKSVDIIGEMSLIEPESLPSATVTAIVESLLLEIPKATIREKMAKDTDFAANFYRAIAIFLSDRLRQMYLVKV